MKASNWPNCNQWVFIAGTLNSCLKLPLTSTIIMLGRHLNHNAWMIDLSNSSKDVVKLETWLPGESGAF